MVAQLPKERAMEVSRPNFSLFETALYRISILGNLMRIGPIIVVA